MKNIVLLSLLVLFSCRQVDSTCEVKSLKTLETHERGMKVLGTGVEHYVLIDLKRGCLDSSLIVDAALRYKDTIGKSEYEIAMPVNILRFYVSDKDFGGREARPNDKRLNKNCLVAITFGYYKTPNHYVFYNENGDIIYSGNKWLR